MEELRPCAEEQEEKPEEEAANLALVLDAAPEEVTEGETVFNAADDFVQTQNQVENLDLNAQTGGASPKMIQVDTSPHHFELLKLIGEGAFGKVLLVRNKLDERFYAMKVISKALLRKKNNIQYMKSERNILTQVDHPFIVSLWYAFQTDQKLYLVMDFLAGGELFYHLRKRGLILEKESRVYFAEMILAIEFLHGIGVIHRDLKPENVLLKDNGHICITDFGLAKEIGDGVSTRTLCGTSEYMAPEMLTRNGYGKAVDWWSLGALFYEVLVGKAPFVSKNQKELDKKILTEKLTLPPFLTASAHSLLKGMLERDVNKRLGAAKSTMFSIGGVSALKQHDFFKGLNWTAVYHEEVPAPIPITGFDPSSVHHQPNQPDATMLNHFDAGFTSQTISHSFVEDCIMGANSKLGSNIVSPGELDASGVDEFAGFEYSYAPIECSEEKYLMFESELSNKLQKLHKKRQFKEKREEERLKDAARKEAQLAEEKRLQVEREMEQKARKEREAQILDLNSKRKQLAKRKDAAISTFSALQQEHSELALEAEKTSRKSKNLKKKLREIVEIESKGAELSKEQREKISKKDSIESELSALDEYLDSSHPQLAKALSQKITAESARLQEELRAFQAEIQSQSSALGLEYHPVDFSALFRIDSENASANQASKESDCAVPTSAPVPASASTSTPVQAAAPAPAPSPVMAQVPVPAPAPDEDEWNTVPSKKKDKKKK